MGSDVVPRIGEVYMMNFSGTGSEQSGYRPGVIFQNNVGNSKSPNVIALPLTSRIKKTSQPTHVFLPKELGLVRDSMVLCENPERMSKDRIGNFLFRLPAVYIARIAAANLLASSAISYLTLEDLSTIWSKAVALNSLT